MPDDAPEEAVQARVSAGGLTFGERDAALLRAVDRSGSLSQAAEALGRSYSRAHQRVQALESVFDTLVESTRGGDDGGGTTLTERGRALLTRYDRFRASLNGLAAAPETAFEGTVTDRQGDLATVRTAAGVLRAVVPTDATAVSVAVRADAVTLYEPADRPDPTATSARNSLEGEVASVSGAQGTVDVRVEVGGPQPLAAIVTRESADRLDLRPGRPVVASFKATATRGVAREPSGV
jgi:molybdate transport system regulatory protein